MVHGGKRAGAGRKKGSLTKRTKEIAERASAEGRTPLEVMLDNMRHFQQIALDAEATIEGLSAEEFTGVAMTPEEQFKTLLAQVKKAAGLRQMAQQCASDAAPFVHPRLAAMTHTGKDGGPIQTQDVNARDIVSSALTRIATREREGGDPSKAQ